jgi:hypothetical protein
VTANLFIGLAFLVLIVVFALLIRWARTRSTGAIVAGALITGMAPDPLLEAQLKVVHEEQQKAPEDDESGAGRD